MKRLIKYTLIAILVIAALLVGAGYYMIGYALKPDGLESRSRDTQGSYERVFTTYPELKPWTDSLRTANALHDCNLTDGYQRNLHALYVPAARPTRKTAVLIHGYEGNSIDMLHIGYLYSRQLGYNILLPDLHAHGQSDGDAIRMGWLDRLDVKRWIDEASRLFGDSIEIVVHGVSMGAATTMMVSGDSLPGSVRCFVEDCGYTSVWDEFKGELKNQFGLPAFPLLHVASWLCDILYGWNFHEASALQQVKHCTLPMLFIHGDADDFVPTWMVYPLYEAKPEPKELWLVPGAAHAVAYKENKAEYTRRIRDFVSKYIR